MVIAFQRCRLERAPLYRDRARGLRQMADDEPNERLRENLIDLAQDYEELAATINAGAFSVTRKPEREKFLHVVDRFRVWRSS